MLLKLLSNVILFIRDLFTRPDYYIISEELEYKIDHDMKYLVEDDFWMEESKHWEDGILDEYYTTVSGKKFRNTIIPQNVTQVILRVKYVFNGHVYTAISNNINFKPGDDDSGMTFCIPVNNAWIVDHDDKPMIDITPKVKRYAGPRNDFHKQKLSLRDFLFYDEETLKDKYPKIVISNALGMKKTLYTLENYTTDIILP